MRKYIIFAIILIVGGKFGFDYLTSEKFQAYGDRTNAPWTCQVTLVLGNFYVTTSEYDEAFRLFDRIRKRCPDSDYADTAEFNEARCLEMMRRSNDAMIAYLKYAERHPGSRRTKIAVRAAEILRSGG